MRKMGKLLKTKNIIGLKETVSLVTLFALLFSMGAIIPLEKTEAQSWPRCASGCTANNITVTSFEIKASGTCTPGQPTSAELWGDFHKNQNASSYCVVLVGDIYIDGSLSQANFTKHVVNSLPTGTGPYSFKLADITWTCGSEMEIENILVMWKPSSGTCTDDCSGYNNAQCSLNPTGLKVAAPLIANFEASDPKCYGEPIQFTDLTTGGTTPYSYEWDLNNDEETDSTIANPQYTYNLTGDHTVTLEVTDSDSPAQQSTFSAVITVLPPHDPLCGGCNPGDWQCIFFDEDQEGPAWWTQECLGGVWTNREECPYGCEDGACLPECDTDDDCCDGNPCTVNDCMGGSCSTNPLPNDCGELTCGPSPSGCYDCGACDTGSTCIEGRCVEDNLLVTIVAHKIVCKDAEYLPKSGGTQGPNITEDTVSTFLSDAGDSCWLESGWYFQWAKHNVSNPGDNLEDGGSNWNTFGPTDGDGTAYVNIDINEITGDHIWMRESIKDGYLPFSGDGGVPPSAEFYCHKDAYKYDNYDRVDEPEAGETYYCVAFNVPEEPDPGYIIVKKNTNAPEIEQEFTFTTNYSDSFTLKHGDENNSGALPPGNYSVFEAVPDNWEWVSAVCTDGEYSYDNASIDLAEGKTVTCTFLNHYTGPEPEPTGEITVHKEFHNLPGMMSFDYENYCFMVNEDGPYCFDQGGSWRTVEVPYGPYLITEFETGNEWDVSYEGDCEGIMGDISNGNAVSENGLICTIINTLIEDEPVYGCTDETATNYDPDATEDDGSCIYPEDPILGCTDPNATNYDPEATENDGSCTYPEEPIYGCMDPDALNYNPDATKDDESCEYEEEPTTPTRRVGGGPVYIPSDDPEPEEERITIPLGDSETEIEPEVLGEEIVIEEPCGIYLYEYIRYGANNNPEEVKKLQTFLNQHMGESLPITGIYSSDCVAAVNRFQLAYKNEVLRPWVDAGVHCADEPTGRVYKTTQRWINMIMCPELNLPMPDLSGYPEADCEAYWAAVLGEEIIVDEDDGDVIILPIGDEWEDLEDPEEEPAPEIVTDITEEDPEEDPEERTGMLWLFLLIIIIIIIAVIFFATRKGKKATK